MICEVVVSDMMPMACMPSASPLIILIEGQCSVWYFHIEYSRHPEFNGGPIVNSIKQYSDSYIPVAVALLFVNS